VAAEHPQPAQLDGSESSFSTALSRPQMLQVKEIMNERLLGIGYPV